MAGTIGSYALYDRRQLGGCRVAWLHTLERVNGDSLRLESTPKISSDPINHVGPAPR